MTDREVMQQALHELEGIPVYRKYGVRISNAITALRTALAMHQVSDFAQAQEQQAEPVFENLDYVAVVYSPSNAMLKSPLPIGTHLYKYPPQQQAEPICPECKAAVLYECVACSSNNYPPQQQAEPVAWIAEVELSVFARTPKEKTTVEIWKKSIFDSDVAIYTTPPQRQWVGLTDEEVKHEWEVWRANLPRYVGFAKGIEAKLKERNND